MIGKVNHILRELSEGRRILEDHEGLCLNLTKQLLLLKISAPQIWYAQDQVKEIYKTWPKYSGEAKFPVPGGELAYKTIDDKWVGDYGDLRKELCTYVADQLEEKYGQKKTVLRA